MFIQKDGLFEAILSGKQQSKSTADQMTKDTQTRQVIKAVATMFKYQKQFGNLLAIIPD